jgi:hypothetical protein
MINTKEFCQLELAEAIACCIERARCISPKSKNGWPTPDNEIYWYTREKASVLARELGIKWPMILKEINTVYCLTFREEMDSEFILKSELFWIKLAHPDIIIEEVMES